MEEKKEKEISQPEDTPLNTDSAEDTIPKDAEEITVPVKYNKEIKNLKLEEASILAQKGMKFDVISADFERVKKMALKQGLSVTEFLNALERQQSEERKNELLSKCGGDEELAEHILALETDKEAKTQLDMQELTEMFPSIKDLSQLPSEVVERAETLGTAVLDEYLRYRIKKQRQKESFEKIENAAKNSAIGSQRESESPIYDPSKNEFLKGLWGR